MNNLESTRTSGRSTLLGGLTFVGIGLMFVASFILEKMEKKDEPFWNLIKTKTNSSKKEETPVQ